MRSWRCPVVEAHRSWWGRGEACRRDARRRDGGRRGADGDAGSATLEFIALTLIMLVPLVYLVIAVGQIQAGTFAVQAAARDGARGAAVQGVAHLKDGFDAEQALVAGTRRAEAAADIAFTDLGVAVAGESAMVKVGCTGGACFEPGTDVWVRVDAQVPLPGMPDFLRGSVPLAVTVSATAVSPIDGLAPTALTSVP